MKLHPASADAGDSCEAGKKDFNKSPLTIYRKPEAKGWGRPFGGATSEAVQ